MGLIAKMLDKFSSGLQWTAGRWRKDEEDKATVCIMGAMGLVLQDKIVHLAVEYLDDDELGAFVQSYNFSPEEDQEIWMLFATICEQYPEWSAINSTCYGCEFFPVVWREERYENLPSLRPAVISAIIAWNDERDENDEFRRCEDDVIAILEKVHIRQSEAV